MIPNHQIRLRGPWQLWLASADDPRPIEPMGRFEAPNGLGDRLPPQYRGPARLERSFHRPTGLQPTSQIHLRIHSDLCGQLSLNGQPLGHLEPGEQRFDITPLLQIRNRICIEVEIDESARMRQPSCDARLEIFA